MNLLLALAALCCTAGRVAGLSCVPCTQITCEKPPLVDFCHFGFVLDMCGCCYVCAKGPGETCGGQWAWHGRCGRGLECRYPRGAPGEAVRLGDTPGKCFRPNNTISDKISVFFSWLSALIQGAIMGNPRE